MQLIDSHAHLDFPVFDADRAEVLARAWRAGICQCVVPAVARASWTRVAALCASDPQRLLPAYGLHPVFIREHQSCDLQALEAYLQRPETIAVGECGLDGVLEASTWARQLALFDAQLSLAEQYNLPVVVHARKAFEAVLQRVRQHPGVTGVIHCFGGSYEQAKRLIDLGYYLGFGGPVTYPRAKRLSALLKRLPLECVVLESDAPDQPPAEWAKQRNEPAYISATLHSISATIGLPVEELACLSVSNTKQLFNLS